MTTLYKILKLQVGESESATGRKQKEMRDIGVVLKHSANGNEWQSIKLNAELLPPVQQRGHHAVRSTAAQEAGRRGTQCRPGRRRPRRRLGGSRSSLNKRETL